MSKPHRIAAGGILFRDDSVMLVRYPRSDGSSYLVGPGGGLEENENVNDAIVREFREETGLVVNPQKVLFIEDLECLSYKMCKIWMLCSLLSGEVSVTLTEEAKLEGIADVGWYKLDDLRREEVFPPPLLKFDWHEFKADSWDVQVLPSRLTDF